MTLPLMGRSGMRPAVRPMNYASSHVLSLQESFLRPHTFKLVRWYDEPLLWSQPGEGDERYQRCTKRRTQSTKEVVRGARLPPVGHGLSAASRLVARERFQLYDLTADPWENTDILSFLRPVDDNPSSSSSSSSSATSAILLRKHARFYSGDGLDFDDERGKKKEEGGIRESDRPRVLRQFVDRSMILRIFRAMRARMAGERRAKGRLGVRNGKGGKAKRTKWPKEKEEEEDRMGRGGREESLGWRYRDAPEAPMVMIGTYLGSSACFIISLVILFCLSLIVLMTLGGVTTLLVSTATTTAAATPYLMFYRGVALALIVISGSIGVRAYASHYG